MDSKVVAGHKLSALDKPCAPSLSSLTPELLGRPAGLPTIQAWHTTVNSVAHSSKAVASATSGAGHLLVCEQATVRQQVQKVCLIDALSCALHT